jgi:hypothetical protein
MIWNNARVHVIEGQDNQAFGYMCYLSYLRVPVKVVDE